MLAIREIECDGYAIGGLAVGESADVMYHIIETVEPYMPVDKPRYLMGVGTPQNIVEAVYRGVDFFDCVMPSRNARHGNLFTWNGKMIKFPQIVCCREVIETCENLTPIISDSFSAVWL